MVIRPFRTGGTRGPERTRRGVHVVQSGRGRDHQGHAGGRGYRVGSGRRVPGRVYRGPPRGVRHGPCRGRRPGPRADRGAHEGPRVRGVRGLSGGTLQSPHVHSSGFRHVQALPTGVRRHCRGRDRCRPVPGRRLEEARPDRGHPEPSVGCARVQRGCVQLLAKCLKDFPGLQLSVNLNGWPKNETAFDNAAGILLYMDGGKNHPAIQQNKPEFIAALMKKGVGLMCAHYGVEVPKDKGGPEFQDWIGGYYEDAWSCNPIWRPEFKEFPKHPIANGVQPFAAEDEWYFNMRFRPEMKGVTGILTAVPPDKVRDGPYVYPKGPYKHIQEAQGRAQ